MDTTENIDAARQSFLQAVREIITIKAEDIAAPTNPGLTIPWGIKEDDIYDGGSKPMRGPRVIKLHRLMPSTFNPRTKFDQESLRSLADSIKEHGILEPLIVREVPESRLVLDYNKKEPARYFWLDGKRLDREEMTYHGPYLGLYESESDAREDLPFYEIVAGERRFRAATLAMVTDIPVIIRNLTDEEALQIAVIENLQRADLDPFDQARGFEMLRAAGMRQTQIAQKVGCSQSLIAKSLGMLKLPEPVRALVTAGKLTPSHAQRLLSFVDFPPVVEALANGAVALEWKVAQLETPLRSEVISELTRKKVATDVRRSDVEDKGFPCYNCPFGAYRKGESEWRNLCMKPDHYAELTAAYEQRKVAESEAQIQAAREKYSKALPVVQSSSESEPGTVDPYQESVVSDSGLPLINKLRDATFRRLFDRPAGCTDDGESPCACRAAGIFETWNGERSVVPICTNPARFDELKRLETQAKQDAKKPRLLEAHATCSALISNPPEQLKRFLNAQFVMNGFSMNPNTKILGDVAERFGIAIDPKKFANYDSRHESIKILATLPVDKQNELLFTYRLSFELKNGLEGSMEGLGHYTTMLMAFDETTSQEEITQNA